MTVIIKVMKMMRWRWRRIEMMMVINDMYSVFFVLN